MSSKDIESISMTVLGVAIAAVVSFAVVAVRIGEDFAIPVGIISAIAVAVVLRGPVGKALGVIVTDADADGWPDIFVANDTVRNFFFHNEAGPNGARIYKEIGEPIGAAYADQGKPRGGMAIDWGEFAAGRSAAVIANFATEPYRRLATELEWIGFSNVSVILRGSWQGRDIDHGGLGGGAGLGVYW